MTRQIQIRRGTATEHNNFTGAIGELTMDTTNKTLRIHDGSTAGGTKLAKTSDLNAKADTDLSNLSTAGKALGAGLAMPSDTIQNLTLGASGTIYTASNDGYISLRITIASGGFCQISVSGTNHVWSIDATSQTAFYFPVRSGQLFQIDYSDRITQSYDHFVFIKAQGVA